MIVSSSQIDPNLRIDNRHLAYAFPLHQAILEGNEESVKGYLAGDSIDFNAKDENGLAPLSLLVNLLCYPDQNIHHVSDDQLVNIAIQMLENNRIDPNIKDKNGNTPLSVLLKHKQFEFARLFLSYPKTDPNIFKGYGHTELTQALYVEDLDIVEFLLSFPQTDPNLRNKNGELPLDLALRCGERNKRLEKVMWFLAHPKTVVASQLDNGDTPLSVAIKLRLTEIVKLLLPHDKEGASIALGNYEQLAQFQKKNFLTFSEKEIEKIKTEHQNELDALYHLHIESAADVKADFVTYYAVENMSEVDSILSKTSLNPNTHRVGFIDVDETLVFSGLLGWLNECFHPENMDIIDRLNVSLLLKKYGFMSAVEFANWGNDKFGIFAGIWDSLYPLASHYIFTGKANFCNQCLVTDSNVPSIFYRWHEEGMNLYCLTARGFDEGFTKEELKEDKIDLEKLSSIHIEEPEKGMSSGIIFSKPKFGTNTGGIQFLELYLEKLAPQHFSNIEIIVVDNNKEIFAQIISLSNRQEIQRLEQKFNIKMSFRYFQPFEELWQSPHENWNNIKKYVDNHNPKEIALQALRNFLETFCTPDKNLTSDLTLIKV